MPKPLFSVTSEVALQHLNALVLSERWITSDEETCDTDLNTLLASWWAGKPEEFTAWWTEFNDADQAHTAQQHASALHTAIIQKCWLDNPEVPAFEGGL